LLSNFRNRGIALLILHGNKDAAFAHAMVERVAALAA
jgi:hypothetical protein